MATCRLVSRRGWRRYAGRRVCMQTALMAAAAAAAAAAAGKARVPAGLLKPPIDCPRLVFGVHAAGRAFIKDDAAAAAVSKQGRYACRGS